MAVKPEANPYLTDQFITGGDAGLVLSGDNTIVR
jgi:hypothetical protein